VNHQNIRFSPESEDALAPIGEQALSERPDEGGPPPGAEGLAGLDVAHAGSRSRISANTILLLGVVAVAGGVLLGMRRVGLGPASAVAAMPFDKDLVESASKPSRDHRGVLADLNASRVRQQVPDDKVKRNPFRLDMAADLAMTSAEALKRSAELLRAEAEKAKKMQAEREKAFQSGLAGLRLQAVMGGSTPRARINGKVVGLGDRLGAGDMFVLKAVHGRGVELEAEGKTYLLEFEAKPVETDPSMGDLSPLGPAPASTPPAQPWATPGLGGQGKGGF
jgi:hypothetical protein